MIKKSLFLAINVSELIDLQADARQVLCDILALVFNLLYLLE